MRPWFILGLLVVVLVAAWAPAAEANPRQAGAGLYVVEPGVAIPAPVAKPEATTDAMAPAAVRQSLDAWSAKAGVSPSLVRALAWVESGDQANAPNGVLQTLPATRTFVEDVLVGHKLPRTPDGDIEVGVLYLQHLLSEFKGNQRLALAAWNEGDTSVLQRGILPSTKTFVDNVLALAARL